MATAATPVFIQIIPGVYRWVGRTDVNLDENARERQPLYLSFPAVASQIVGMRGMRARAKRPVIEVYAKSRLTDFTTSLTIS